MTRDTNGQEYFYLTSVNGRGIEIVKGYDYGHAPETEHFNSGNYFTTRAMAVWNMDEIKRILSLNKEKISTCVL